jgi:hypothetical protein
MNTMNGGKIDNNVIENIEKVGLMKKINQTYLKHINESKFVVGLAMILLNVGSKYVDFKFTKSQEQLLRNGLAREILIFTIVFMGTRDILYAILLTSAFIVLSEYVFNDKSKYCLVPERMKKIMALVDINKDDFVSPEEEQRALETLRRAEKYREKNMQTKFSSYLNNMNNTVASMNN